MARQPREVELVALCQIALNDGIVQEARSLIAQVADDPQQRAEAIASIAHTFNRVYDDVCQQLARKYHRYCADSQTYYESLKMPMHTEALLFRERAWDVRVMNVQMFSQALSIDPTELLDASLNPPDPGTG